MGEDGTVYVGSQDSNIYALKPDGSLRWKFKTNDMVGSSPAIGEDGTIYIGSSDGYIYAINPDGTLKWKFKTGGDVYSSPTIGEDGTVYVGSSDGYIYALWGDSMGLANSSWPKFRHDARNTGTVKEVSRKEKNTIFKRMYTFKVTY